jgi:hypothetical protein
LTVLLILDLCVIFVAVPLAAHGRPTAEVVGEAPVLAGIVIVALLSHRPIAMVIILLGLAARLASFSLGQELSSGAASALLRGSNIVTFSALSWVVAHAVYAPGRITVSRLQGAVVLYLNLATIFTSAFTLIWNLDPAAFVNLPGPPGGPGEIATMLYFSFTTLTTTGYGDIVPVEPFARSLVPSCVN